MSDPTPQLNDQQWRDEMLVLQSAINQLQTAAMKTGLSKDAIALAGFSAAVTFCRVELIPEDTCFKEACRVVPFRKQMESITGVKVD